MRPGTRRTTEAKLSKCSPLNLRSEGQYLVENMVAIFTWKKNKEKEAWNKQREKRDLMSWRLTKSITVHSKHKIYRRPGVVILILSVTHNVFYL